MRDNHAMVLSVEEQNELRAMSWNDREYLAGYIEGVLSSGAPVQDEQRLRDALAFINRLNATH